MYQTNWAWPVIVKHHHNFGSTEWHALIQRYQFFALIQTQNHSSLYRQLAQTRLSLLTVPNIILDSSPTTMPRDGRGGLNYLYSTMKRTKESTRRKHSRCDPNKPRPFYLCMGRNYAPPNDVRVVAAIPTEDDSVNAVEAGKTPASTAELTKDNRNKRSVYSPSDDVPAVAAIPPDDPQINVAESATKTVAPETKKSSKGKGKKSVYWTPSKYHGLPLPSNDPYRYKPKYDANGKRIENYPIWYETGHVPEIVENCQDQNNSKEEK